MQRFTLTRREALASFGATLAAPFAIDAIARAASQSEPPTKPIDVDATPYPAFMEEPQLSGTVRCVGSSAVGLVLNAARPGFRDSQPNISLEVISSGSGNGPKALASGESDLAPMSRPMKKAEIDEIEAARKCKVEFIDNAIDAIAVCVQKQNPKTRITLKDLDRVFGRERRRGGAPAVTWGDVGVQDPQWAARTITLFGMGADSGSNGLVQEIVLQGGPFRTSVNSEPVSSSVIQAVATDPNAIGYCSAYFKASRVRQLEIEMLDGSGFALPTDELVRSGKYPLARSLRLYFVRDPAKPSPATMKFLQFLVSQDGQELIGDLGQKTLSPAQAHEMTNRVK